jgi:ArsR family transcriptional regulator
MAAGAIGEAMGISPSNASFHLAHLERAGLSASRRDMRSIIYRADIEGLADLARFLLQDCCGGHPEVCGPALTSVLDPCCRAETTDV